MQAMDRFSLVLVLPLLSMIVLYDAGCANVPVPYNSHLNNEHRRPDVVFEQYDSFKSMQHLYSNRPLHKRQTDGSIDGNVTVLNNHHIYYTSKFFQPGDSADRIWFELSDITFSGSASGVSSGSGYINSESGSGSGSGSGSEIGYELDSGTFVKELGENTTEILTDAHRVYQIWQLKFRFPYYGHLLNAVGVTTGGFLYTGTIFHQQIHLSQYISPLMADFNPSLTASGRVLVYSTEERFTVQWDQVLNHHRESDGPFTFQVSIFPSGKIYFAYRYLPLLWNELNNDDHPVEIGLADSFYFEVAREFVILVEYSRISARNLLSDENTDLSFSAFEMDPVPNCVTANTCDSCMAITSLGVFNCSWCETAEQKCSDGVDRFAQKWFDNGCLTNAVSTCPLPTVSPSETSTTPSASIGPNPLSVGSVVGIVLGGVLLAIAIATGCFGILAFYAVRHPKSKIGTFMIENCPKTCKTANQSYEMVGKLEFSDPVSSSK